MSVEPVKRVRGRALAAARVMAGMSVRELADKAGVNKSTIADLEGRDEFGVTLERRHGYVWTYTWEKIVTALRSAGVEFVPGNDLHGDGVRWTVPR